MKKFILIISLFTYTLFAGESFTLKEPAVFMAKRTGVVKSVMKSTEFKDNSIVTIVFLDQDQLGVSLPNKVSENLKKGTIISLFIQENRIISLSIIDDKRKAKAEELMKSIK